MLPARTREWTQAEKQEAPEPAHAMVCSFRLPALHRQASL
jgi:hypothetical protein